MSACGCHSYIVVCHFLRKWFKQFKDCLLHPFFGHRGFPCWEVLIWNCFQKLSFRLRVTATRKDKILGGANKTICGVNYEVVFCVLDCLPVLWVCGTTHITCRLSTVYILSFDFRIVDGFACSLIGVRPVKNLSIWHVCASSFDLVEHLVKFPTRGVWCTEILAFVSICAQTLGIGRVRISFVSLALLFDV